VVIEKHSNDTIAEVFQSLDVPLFRPNEVTFLKEYCLVMHPLAIALDILQAETKCYIGYLLPTLYSLRTKLLALMPTLTVAAPLAIAVLHGIDERFATYYSRSDLIIASVTLPQFRLRWIEDDVKKGQARTMLYDLVRGQGQQHEQQHNSQENVTDSDDDFFSFGVSVVVESTSEVDLYLSETFKDIESLKKFPQILNLFKKYNTPLPSSAPVERLFSLGGQILTPRRNRLSDSHFQRQLLLRANKAFL
jgi:hypothetical protein